MQLTVTNKLVILAASLAVAFGMAFTAYASYDDLEIEIEVYADRVEVEVEYGDESEDYTYNDADLEEALDGLVVDLEEDFDIDLTASQIEDLAEIDNKEDEDAEEDASDAIKDAEEEIADAAERIEDAEAAEEDEDDLEAASTTLAEAKALLADAEEEFDAENYEEAEELADEAKDLAESIFEDYDDDEDGDDSEFCDQTSQAAGWGVAKKCVDDEDYVINDKMAQKVERFQDKNMEKYRDYGKSTDQTELQNQLRELLLVLIQLLTQQMALQQGN